MTFFLKGIEKLVPGPARVFLRVIAAAVALVSKVEVSDTGYVALGDSQSSGEGIPPWVGKDGQEPGDKCHRSKQGYPKVLGEEGRALENLTLAFYACSGAEIAAIGTQATEAFLAPELAPELLKGLTHPKAQVVTLTAGGNDAGWAQVVTACLQFGCENALKRAEAGEAEVAEKKATVNRANRWLYEKVLPLFRKWPEHLVALKANLKSLYRSILDKNQNGNSKVFVVGYPNLFPLKYTAGRECESVDLRTKPIFPVKKAEQTAEGARITPAGWAEETLPVLERLEAEFRETAKSAVESLEGVYPGTDGKPRLKYVEGAELFGEDHNLCAPESSFFSPGKPIPEGTFHPNVAGQDAIGENPRKRRYPRSWP